MPTTVTVPDPAAPVSTDDNAVDDPFHRPPLSSQPEKSEAAAAALRRPGVEVQSDDPSIDPVGAAKAKAKKTT
jgi:hypothetical protein